MVSVKSHRKRSKKGKVYKVKKHSRVKKRKRPLGTKISYKPVGQYQVASDEHGNLRGSRIIKNPAALKKGSTPSQITAAEIKKLDTKYYNREISYEEYVTKMNSLLSQ